MAAQVLPWWARMAAHDDVADGEWPTCSYCGAFGELKLTEPPYRNDVEDEWENFAREHQDDCELIATRGFTD